MRNPKRIVRLVAVSTTISILLSPQVFGVPKPGDPCNCSETGDWPFNDSWTGTWTVSNDTGDVETKVQKDSADCSIGANPCNDTGPGSVTCGVTQGSVVVKEWEVSGGIDFHYFNVSAQTGGNITVNYGANCSGTISDWCKELHFKAGYKYSTRTVTMHCNPGTIPSGVTSYSCDADVTGSHKHGYQGYCEGGPKDTPDCFTGPCGG